jgi:hypothetical protein
LVGRGAMDFGKRSRSTGGGGGFSLLLFIAFCIKVYIDGKWAVPIVTFTVDYVVCSLVAILVWALVIFGIPGVIALHGGYAGSFRRGPQTGPSIYA